MIRTPPHSLSPVIQPAEQPAAAQTHSRGAGTPLNEQAVVISERVAPLAESAEELSLFMAERVEQKLHAERVVKAGRINTEQSGGRRRIQASEPRSSASNQADILKGKPAASPAPRARKGKSSTD